MTLRYATACAMLVGTVLTATLSTAQVQIFTATHTYILGDHDSKDDARQRCLLEAKRKVLEQAGVYIESTSEAKDFALTKDKITSFAAAVMQVRDTKEEVSFQQGHMTLMVTLTATVDLAEVQRQLAARQADKGVRDTVADQQERLKRLEAQLEAIQQTRQAGQRQGHGEPKAHLLTELERALLIKEAYEGDAESQNILGILYDTGQQGLPQDYLKARQWFEKSASKGNAWAQYNLGAMYDSGDGVPKDYVTARKWYEKAAAQGHAKAQRSLGLLYKNGQGTPKNYARAREWYERAAAQGEVISQVLLGTLYVNGEGVPKDYTKARQWIEKAAAQGDSGGQVLLALLYKNGQGVPQDDVRAYMWYSLAATSSTGEDQKFKEEIRDIFARRLNPEQFAEGQRLAREWTETFEKRRIKQ